MNDTILILFLTLFQEKKDGTDSITEVSGTVVIVVTAFVALFLSSPIPVDQ